MLHLHRISDGQSLEGLILVQWSSSVDIPVLFCTACAMLSVNKSLYPTCTVPADFKRHEHQLAIADAKAQVSLDHMKMHDKLIVRRQWTASAVLNSHGYGQPVVDSQRTTEQYGIGRTHTASPLHSTTIGATTPKAD